MQTVLSISRLTPFGTKVLVKRPPVEVETRGFIIPEEYRDRNELKGQLYPGVVIAVGPKTYAARYGHQRNHFEPGDLVWWHGLWDWKDREVVIKDEESGESYMIVDEAEIKAIEVEGGS